MPARKTDLAEDESMAGPSIQTYFTAHPLQSTPSLFLNFILTLEPDVSARNRGSSISSGATFLESTPLSLPASAALTQLRSVCSISSNSLATPRRLAFLDALDRQFLELSGVFLFRAFFQAPKVQT